MKKTKKDCGYFTFKCCHTNDNVFGLGKAPSCGKPATRHEYGMDRCEDHKTDLNPKNWPANQEK